MADLTGKTVGNYRVVERIGRGGMATVYKAFQPSLERYVAVKVIHEMLVAEDDQFLKRFHREAKSVAALRHPNIVQVFDFGVQNEIPYMVMEYLEGVTLKEELRSLSERGETMAWMDVHRIFKQIASAVDYAHSQGMVHRDLKPANIMLTAKGDVVLTDFGVARIIGGTQYTVTGVIAGTPAYLSPEQGKGERGDARSDIYALGIILYEMLTGQVPFDADTPWAIIVKHISDPLPLPRQLNPKIPEKAEQVILKALSKAPEDRYQSAAAMVKALDHTMVGETGVVTGPVPRPVSPRERPTEVLPPPHAPATRRFPPWLWAIGGAIVGIALFAIAFMVFRGQDTAEATSRAPDGTTIPSTAGDENATPSPEALPSSTSAPAAVAAGPTSTLRPSATPAPTRTRPATVSPVPEPTEPSAPAVGRTLQICADATPPQICVVNSIGESTPLSDGLSFDAIGSLGWAPDGRHLLFVARSGQANASIYTFDLVNRRAVKLTGDDTHEQSAEWSPDGTWIAFIRECGLWLMRPDGSDAHALLESSNSFCGEALSWSPSGEQIALINFSTADRSNHGIWIVDRGGASSSRIVTSDRLIGGGETAWSPDGGQIFCWCNDGGASWLQLIRADGRGEAEFVVWEPTWWRSDFWPPWGTIDYDQTRVASVDLGRRNEYLGLRPLQGGDGLTRATTIGGVDARATVFNGSGGRFIYFDVDDRFLSAEETRVTVIVEYFDQGNFPLGIHYDSTDSRLEFRGTFKESDPFINLRNSGEWKTVTFVLPDAYFGNRQQDVADFRIATDDNDLFINNVTVVKP